MTLNSPEIKKKIAGWEQELRVLTGNDAVLLTSFVVNEVRLPWDLLLKAVMKCTKVSKRGIQGKCRKEEIVTARQLMAYFGMKYTGLKGKRIGARLNQGHTTVYSNCRVIKRRLEVGEPSTCKLVSRINKILFPESNPTTYGQ